MNAYSYVLAVGQPGAGGLCVQDQRPVFNTPPPPPPPRRQALGAAQRPQLALPAPREAAPESAVPPPATGITVAQLVRELRDQGGELAAVRAECSRWQEEAAQLRATLEEERATAAAAAAETAPRDLIPSFEKEGSVRFDGFLDAGGSLAAWTRAVRNRAVRQ